MSHYTIVPLSDVPPGSIFIYYGRAGRPITAKKISENSHENINDPDRDNYIMELSWDTLVLLLDKDLVEDIVVVPEAKWIT